jgi:fatty acid-binding protein DegV
VDDEGHLVNVAKSRGRKASLNALAQRMVDLELAGENDTIFISHGDCLEDAEYVARLLKEKCGVKNVIINYVGAVIGAHTGPGVVALFFLGKHR